jgi:hypothetical protein
MTGGTGKDGFTRDEVDRLREAFALTGFPCALRALRELEARQESDRRRQNPAA